MAVEAPLTFGQLSTWRSIETFAADRLMEVNVPALWDVTGLTETEVRRGLRRLTARHEALRTTFHTRRAAATTAGNASTTAGSVPTAAASASTTAASPAAGPPAPFQRVHDELPFTLGRVELPHPDPLEAQRVLRELYARPFPVVGDPGRHGVLITVAGRPVWLAVSMSHMVVDVWAIRALEAELRLAARQDAGAAAGPAPAPRALAALQHGDAWAARRRGAEKHWRRVLDGGPLRNLPVPAGSSDPRGASGGLPYERRVQATLRSHGLAVLLAGAARTHKVSPQSLLTALTAAALAGLLGRDAVTLSLMCANRFDPAWLPVISTMNQLVPLPCPVDRDAPLAAFVKRTHLQALLAYRHGCYDVDAAAVLAAAAPGPDGTPFTHDCWFNYVTAPEDDGGSGSGPESDAQTGTGTGTEPGTEPAAAPPAAVPDATLDWSPPPRNAGHPFYLRVNGDGARWAELTLRVDPARVPQDAVPELLRTVAAGARRLLHAPDATVGALLDGAARDPLPADVFPPAPASAPPAPAPAPWSVQLPR